MMRTVEKTGQKINLIILCIVVITSMLMAINSYASTAIVPSDNQYLELRATTITDVEGQGKQVVMELWGHDIDFKRI